MPKISKTNAMRLLDKAKITYQTYTYEHQGEAVDGVHVAQMLNQNPEQVFKTLICVGHSKQYYVFMVPVAETLHLKEAASLLGVSEMTIRRDLNGHSGPVVLLGGYIVLEPRSATHYLLSDQKTRLVEEKRRAARHAAALLEAHQMAFFDCGTTTPWIIDAIDDALPFTGVCYSLNTFLALQEKPQCRAVLCGGEFHASNAIFMPLSLEDTLSHLSPDIAFYSAAGIDCEQGATCYNLEELPVKHWAMRHARYHVLVVDHSKFGKVRPARMGALAKFDVIASDICPDDELVALAKAQQISLLY